VVAYLLMRMQERFNFAAEIWFSARLLHIRGSLRPRKLQGVVKDLFDLGPALRLHSYGSR
jgi:hypothetical protein